jgi:hypothetical protein
MTYPKWPSDLARKNQRLIAERTGWPDGALEACAELEDRYPGWYISWRRENTTPGFERPAGFYAKYDHSLHVTEVWAPTAEALDSLLVDVPEHDHSVRGWYWCLARL